MSEYDKSIGKIEGQLIGIRDQLDKITDRENRIDVNIESLRHTVENKVESLGRRVASIEKKQYTIITIASIIWAAVALFFRKFM